jgi:uncharacterized protein YbaP (TraB family)
VRLKDLETAARRTLAAALGGVAAAALLAAAPAASEPALWVVKDEDSTVYLFGTVHLLRSDTTWNTPRIQKAMEDSKELWLEIVDVDGQDQAKMQQLVAQIGLDPARPLSSKLNDAQKAKLAEVAAEYGVPVQNLEPLKPWLAGLTFALLPLQKAGFDPNAGVDKLLKAQAEKEGDAIRAFETTEQQLRFFDNLPEAQQVAFLEQALEDAEEGVALLDKLVEAWAAGDSDTIGRILNDEMKTEAPELYDVLLTKRNEDWAGQIEKIMAGSGTHFVAVGAGHLAGPDSVQAKLAARGLKAERVN